MPASYSTNAADSSVCSSEQAIVQCGLQTPTTAKVLPVAPATTGEAVAPVASLLAHLLFALFAITLACVISMAILPLAVMQEWGAARHVAGVALLFVACPFFAWSAPSLLTRACFWLCWVLGAVTAMIAIVPVAPGVFAVLNDLGWTPAPEEELARLWAWTLALFVVVFTAVYPAWLVVLRELRRGSKGHDRPPRSTREPVTVTESEGSMSKLEVSAVGVDRTLGPHSHPLTPSDWTRKVLSVLRAGKSHAHPDVDQRDDGGLTTSTRALAKLVGCSNSTVHAALRELAATHVIRTRASQKGTHIWLVDLN